MGSIHASPLARSIQGSPIFGSIASTPLRGYDDRYWVEPNSYEPSMCDPLDSDYVLQITECHQRLKENLQASIQREQKQLTKTGAPEEASNELAQRLADSHAMPPMASRNGAVLCHSNSKRSRHGLGGARRPSGAVGPSEQDVEEETEAHKVDRVYDEKEVAKMIGTMRRQLALEAEGERKSATAALLAAQAAARMAEARKKQEEQVPAWGPSEAEHKQPTPRPAEAVLEGFRERQQRVRHELQAEQHRTDGKLDAYRSIMQDKFADMGARDDDLRALAQTGDPARTVRDAVGQYHRHMLMTGKFYPARGERAPQGIAMSQVEELTCKEAILESSDLHAFWPRQQANVCKALT